MWPDTLIMCSKLSTFRGPAPSVLRWENVHISRHLLVLVLWNNLHFIKILITFIWFWLLHHVAGDVDISLNAASWIPESETELDLQTLWPQWWRLHHQVWDGQCRGRCVRAARGRVRKPGNIIFWFLTFSWKSDIWQMCPIHSFLNTDLLDAIEEFSLSPHALYISCKSQLDKN